MVRCLQFFEESKEPSQSSSVRVMGRFLLIFALFVRSIVARFGLSTSSCTSYFSEQTRDLRLDVVVGSLEDCLSSLHMECFVQ